MSTTQPKKRVALISNQMNVSKEWLDQVKILETGTTGQKIALAGSDKVLDSIQIALACDKTLEVRLTLSENPKLIKLAKLILLRECLSSELEEVIDEEMVRILYVQDEKFVRRRAIIRNSEIPDSIKLDIIDWESDVGVIESLLSRKMSKAVQLRLIHLMSLSEQQAKGIKKIEGYLGDNHWHFAQRLSYAFWVIGFVNMDKETQVTFAEALIQLYQDIQQSDECKNDVYEDIIYDPNTSYPKQVQIKLSEIAHKTTKELMDHPNFDVMAKVILSQIS